MKTRRLALAGVAAAALLVAPDAARSFDVVRYEEASKIIPVPCPHGGEIFEVQLASNCEACSDVLSILRVRSESCSPHGKGRPLSVMTANG